ncbi:MAG TPA: hypothetical protein VK498_13175, partial [Ferruginibacter sp.]|nr:hypothetical protein [Ferruginibacter sp.]
TNSPRMSSLVDLYDLHTGYFKRALDGITDKDAHNRLNTKANHIAWLTGSLVNQRFEMAKSLGVDQKSSTGQLFENNKGIQDDATYPLLEEYKKDWETISPLLRKAFLEVTEKKLESSFEMPSMEMNFYQMISFMIYREANIIGQLALWRRLLGYAGINYM